MTASLGLPTPRHGSSWRRLIDDLEQAEATARDMHRLVAETGPKLARAESRISSLEAKIRAAIRELS